MYKNCDIRAIADIRGGPFGSRYQGVVIFSDVPGGTEVYVEVVGLPQFKPAPPDGQPVGPHGFHIHEYGDCRVGDPGGSIYGRRTALEPGPTATWQSCRGFSGTVFK